MQISASHFGSDLWVKVRDVRLQRMRHELAGIPICIQRLHTQKNEGLALDIWICGMQVAARTDLRYDSSVIDIKGYYSYCIKDEN